MSKQAKIQNLKNNKKSFLSDLSVKRIIIYIWAIFFVGVLGILAIFWMASAGWLGEIPDVHEMENPDIYVSSEIISSDGVLLDRFETERRTPVTYKDLPTHLVDALLAKEDVRFYNHPGIDARATMRAITSAGKDGGASTITQQLAKQLFTKHASLNKVERVLQKIKEWITSVRLEKLYTKEEIIAMYFNKFDFTYGAKGIESAAKVYFNTTTNKLTLEQSALLVSMFQNPVAYNPIIHPDVAKQKRNLVIDQMVKYKKISKEEGELAKASPIVLDRQILVSNNENFSAYYKGALREEIETWLKDYEEETGTKYNLDKDGLKIYVTIDSRMQKMAEASVAEHLKLLQKQFFAEQKNRPNAPFYNISRAEGDKIITQAMMRTDLAKLMKEKGSSKEQIIERFKQKKDSVQIFTWDNPKHLKYEKNISLWDSIRYHKHLLQAGLLSLDPKDGTVKAWVGGIDWNYYKYDHVKQARRQVGSTFKPMVYATAINQLGYTPCHTVSNDPFQYGNWRPKNVNGRYGGTQSLRTALAQSTNVVTARLITQTGVDPVIQMCRDLGIESPIPKDPTIALGSADLTLYEMVGALSTFANGGIYIKPELVMRIEDKTGKVIKDYTPVTREVVNEYVAFTMIDLMEGVVNNGTAHWLRSKYGFQNEIAGKTGTTNGNSDGWFMGLTPNLVTGVWVGCEDRSAHFSGTYWGQGAMTGMPIWANYMKQVYNDGKELGVTREDKFEKPQGIDEKWDCNSLQSLTSYGEDLQSFDPEGAEEASEVPANDQSATDNSNVNNGTSTETPVQDFNNSN